MQTDIVNLRECSALAKILLRDQAIVLVEAHANRRLRQQSLDWLRGLDPELPGDWIVLLAFREHVLCGVTAEHREKEINFTVVRADFRRQGLGFLLFSQKLLCAKSGYVALVAPDNVPCIGMMFKVGFVATGLVDNGNGTMVLEFKEGPWARMTHQARTLHLEAGHKK